MSGVGIQLEGVCHVYGDNQVVTDLTLAVAPGELVCLLGPTGCGKTTTLRLAAGLEPLQSGRVTVGDREVARPGHELPPEARGVGMVFQDFALFPHLNALENICFGLDRMGRAERRGIGLDLLRRLRLEDFADAYPHTLSGGEQQRVALARALAPRPDVMLMDEPFSGLDVRLRDAVREDTLALLGDEGTATLLVTHDPDEAMRMADRIAVMRDGRIVQEGAPDEIYCRPADRFIAEFFGELNVLHAEVEADGRITTPAGCLEAPEICRGTPVEVLVRPEALRLEGADNGHSARVVQTRSLGPFAIVELAVEGRQCHLRCRVPRRDLPDVGAAVGIALDPEQTFVFPRSVE